MIQVSKDRAASLFLVVVEAQEQTLQLRDDAVLVVARIPLWEPVTGPDFKLRDMVRYALGEGSALH